MMARFVPDSDVHAFEQQGWQARREPHDAPSIYSIIMTKPDERSEEEQAIDLFIWGVRDALNWQQRVKDLGDSA